MDMRQPAQLVYGRVEDMPAAEEEMGRGAPLALLALVLVLAVATVGYIVHPAFRGATPPAARACEVIVTATGSPDCVVKPGRSSNASGATPTSSGTKPQGGSAGVAQGS